MTAQDRVVGLMKALERSVAEAKAERDRVVARRDCTGAHDCPSTVHVHGCYADRGRCDSPTEHNGRSTDG